MKKIILACTVLMMFCGGTAYGELIGVNLGLPDILSDSTGNYIYNADTNLFTSHAIPLTITFDNITLFPINGGGATYDLAFYVDESGNFAGGVAGNDLTIRGSSVALGWAPGTLILAGEVTNFGWQDLAGQRAAFDFTFDFTAGVLAPQYAVYGSKGADIITAEASNFTGSWTVNHASNSKVKHDTAPSIPEASTLMLFGSGLSGVLFYVRKKGLIKI